jgi:hypothetical protein
MTYQSTEKGLNTHLQINPIEGLVEVLYVYLIVMTPQQSYQHNIETSISILPSFIPMILPH